MGGINDVEQWLKKTLKPLGFKKKRLEWRKAVGPVEVGMLIYKSRFSSQFFIEMMLVLPSEGDKQ